MQPSSRPWPLDGPFEHPQWFVEECGRLDGRAVRVAVVDSGWDWKGPQPPVEIKRGVSFLPGSDAMDDQDENGHGTACTWLAARVAPGAQFVPVRIFGATLSTAVSALKAAMVWVVEQEFDILSLSLCTGEEGWAEELYEVCDEAQ